MNFLRGIFPRPPSFRRSRKLEKEFSGCDLYFEAPPYSDPFSDIQDWETEPDSFDIFSPDGYRPIKYYDFHDTNKLIEFPFIQALPLFSSRWAFKGVPIIQGYGGYVGLGVIINAIEDLPVNESMFHDKVFVREVYRKYNLTNLQDLNKGLKSDPFDLTQYRWSNYFGPLNCQWLELSGVDWLYFESQPLVSGMDRISLHTAITDKHILGCHFSLDRAGLNAGNAFRQNQRTPWDNYINFIQRIMDSIRLELSPELSIRRAEVQSQPEANSKPIFGCTPQQVEEAKHVMQMWSGRGYKDSRRDKNESHRATPEEVSAFIDKRIQPRPLHNSYPLGEKIEVVPRLPPELLKRPLMGLK
ncbi:hypothetical protein ACJJIF_10180 [Microbulbifer sp. SSSA002]|uniref:hypothetical protein n=1 Tax=unclassified Microbulbifer TaxID=2619833 RepID=UPI00403A06F9